MSTALIQVDHVTQVFPLADGGEYIALRDINLDISNGEFVSLIGHSGCGKSTLLNLLAGLTQASNGGILMQGREVSEPGPDRMVVFQNYSLLPWKTVRQNVELAVNRVMGERSAGERREIVERHLAMVGLSQAADRLPAELSGGMKQRVAIARALAIRPRLLLLDEPFGALDALTRGNLQQQLMQICQEAGVTTVMVTHDVDEALLLSDRVVMMTNGPEAGIGQILTVPFPRPRQRLEVLEHPDFYRLRSELIGFLQQQRRLRQRKASLEQAVAATRPAAAVAPGEAVAAGAPAAGVPQGASPAAAAGARSRTLVRLGYLPGLDVAPLALAIDQQLFDPAVLKLVPTPFATWERLEEALREGRLDAAITPATTPLALNLGLGGQEPWPAITPMTVSRNGNALCLARQLAGLGVDDRDSLREWLIGRDRPLTVAVPQRRGIAELLLRHWLAGGAIDPDRQVRFLAMAPLAMQGSLRNEQIDAFIAGRYRVAQAVQERQGSVLATDREIWEGHPEKVLTCHEAWAAAHQEALLELCAGLIRAAQRCDDSGQRQTMVQVLSQPQWLGTRAAQALGGQFRLRPQEGGTATLRFNHFHADRAQAPNRAEGAWMLSQFSRWGWIPFPSNRLELLEQTYRPELCDRALLRAGLAALRPDRLPFTLADGIAFDQDDPLSYLRHLPGSPQPPQATVPLPQARIPSPLPA
jgi:nitrate/nitrite transport system ATP-binding protein